jgi:hypothetical protein
MYPEGMLLNRDGTDEFSSGFRSCLSEIQGPASRKETIMNWTLELVAIPVWMWTGPRPSQAVR